LEKTVKSRIASGAPLLASGAGDEPPDPRIVTPPPTITTLSWGFGHILFYDFGYSAWSWK